MNANIHSTGQLLDVESLLDATAEASWANTDGNDDVGIESDDEDDGALQEDSAVDFCSPENSTASTLDVECLKVDDHQKQSEYLFQLTCWFVYTVIQR